MGIRREEEMEMSDDDSIDDPSSKRRRVDESGTAAKLCPYSVRPVSCNTSGGLLPAMIQCGFIFSVTTGTKNHNECAESFSLSQKSDLAKIPIDGIL